VASSGKNRSMKHQRLLWLSRSVLLIGVLVIGGACSKKASRTQPASANSAPAASPAADKGGNPSAEGGALPASIDLAKLDEFKRKIFDQVVNREPSACGKGHSLLHSVTHDSACRASFYAVRYVARLADSGFSETEIGEKLEQRYRTPRVPYIDVSRAPSKGSPSGRVTIVEFADFECPHCNQAQALMHTLVTEYPKDIALYFKHFPLSGNNALNAALGSSAAQNQGKFWQFTDKVWASSERLTPAVLESIAKEIGLDFARWYSEVGSDEVRTRVQQDRAEARSLGIHRTPAVFINGRRYPYELDLPGLRDWIDEELGR
jgi:protein-disulfide isomerase